MFISANLRLYPRWSHFYWFIKSRFDESLLQCDKHGSPDLWRTDARTNRILRESPSANEIEGGGGEEEELNHVSSMLDWRSSLFFPVVALGLSLRTCPTRLKTDVEVTTLHIFLQLKVRGTLWTPAHGGLKVRQINTNTLGTTSEAVYYCWPCSYISTTRLYY